MTSLAKTGRVIGVGILAGYVLEIANNFFIQPMIRQGEGPIGLFAGAAAQPGLIGVIVLVGMISGVISLLIAALFCRESIARPFAWLAFLFLGFKATSFGLSGGELASYQLYRSLGDAMAADPGGALAGMVKPVWIMVTAQRNGLHFPTMLLGGAGAFTMYVLLFQSGWVPRWLAVAGLFATTSQMTGVFTGVLGSEVSLYFLAPLALVQLVLGLWLVLRGFEDRAAIG
jgi:hypothetical protein